MGGGSAESETGAPTARDVANGAASRDADATAVDVAVASDVCAAASDVVGLAATSVGLATGVAGEAPGAGLDVLVAATRALSRRASLAAGARDGGLFDVSPAPGAAGADKMLGGARRARDPVPLVDKLGGAETRRLDARGGVSGFGLSGLGASSRGGTLGSGTARPVRFEGAPERRAGSEGGRERVSAEGAVTSTGAGGAGRERVGALGAAANGDGGVLGALGGLGNAEAGRLGRGGGLLGVDGTLGTEPMGRDGSGTGGGSRPATS